MKQKQAKKQKGQSLVEMAIMLPIMLILLAGLIDFGLAFFSFIALRDAAAEGATYGAIDPTNTNGIIDRVRTSSTEPVDLTDTTNVAVTVTTDGSPCAGEALTVTVVYTYPIITPFVGTVVGGQTIPVTASVTGTVLTPACP